MLQLLTESAYSYNVAVTSASDSVHRIVASLVRAQPLQFFWNILRWLLVAVPATWTNSWLSYVQNKLAIAYRTRLTQVVMKEYLGGESEDPQGKVYYKLGTSFFLFDNEFRYNLSSNR